MYGYVRCGGVSKSYTCPRCGKTFNVPYQTKGGGRTEWVYRRMNGRKKEYYCSYHCFRDVQIEQEVRCHDGCNA